MGLRYQTADWLDGIRAVYHEGYRAMPCEGAKGATKCAPRQCLCSKALWICSQLLSPICRITRIASRSKHMWRCQRRHSSLTSVSLNRNLTTKTYNGNATVARHVAATAAKNLTPTLLELGGKNPLIISKDVNSEGYCMGSCLG